MTSREKYLERHRRYNASEKGRVRYLRYWQRRMDEDPLFALRENQRKTLDHVRRQLEKSIERAELFDLTGSY